MTLTLLPTPSSIATSIESVTTTEADLILLHNRMGHFNHHVLSHIHSSAKGVPKIWQTHKSKTYHTCMRCKAKKAAKGHGNIINAKSVGQGISMDWVFVTINSSD